MPRDGVRSTPSPRRRAGGVLRRLDAKRRTNRDAGPAPGARPSGTWPCSGPWPPSPSAGARPSPRPRGRRARTWAFLNTVSGRAFAASSAATSASLRVSKISFILGVSCAAARGAAAGRARQPARDAFFTAIQRSRRAARGPAASRRVSGGLRGVKLLNKCVGRWTFTHSQPRTAWRRCAARRPWRCRQGRGLGRSSSANLPPAFLLSKDHDDMACGKRLHGPARDPI